jgi:hypothetical protein
VADYRRRREARSATESRMRWAKARDWTHVNLGPLAVTLDLSLGGERVHQGLDGVSGVALLNETNGRVDLEKTKDANVSRGTTESGE